MKLVEFLSRIQYCRECPSWVNPARWSGMRKWLETRLKEMDWEELLELVSPSQQL